MSIFSKLFGSKEAKSAGQMTLDFPWPLIFNKSQLAEWYRQGLVSTVTYQNAWLIARATEKVAVPVSSLPVGLYRRGKDDELIESDPVLDRLASPNPLMGRRKLFHHITAHYLLSGNGYVVLNDSKLGMISGDTSKRGRVAAMWPVPKKRVTIEQMPEGGVVYRVAMPGGNEEFIDSDHMINVVRFNPESLTDGVSVIDGIRDILGTYQAAAKWNRSLLRNAARPSGALSTDQLLTDAQFARLSEQLDKKYQGQENAGKLMLLESGLKYQQMAYSPADLEWLSTRKLTIKEVALAFGIPPELMGDGENKTYSNQREARRDFYTDTIVPLCNDILESFNRMFWQDGAFELRIMESKVAVLQSTTAEKVAALREAWWLTPNQRLAEMNQEQSDDPLMDKVYVPSGYLPIEDLGGGAIEDAMPPRKPAPDDMPEDEDDE